MNKFKLFLLSVACVVFGARAMQQDKNEQLRQARGYLALVEEAIDNFGAPENMKVFLLGQKTKLEHRIKSLEDAHTNDSKTTDK